ncbi:MAG TPA: hypothetical protein VJJ82_03505 [Candidatus Nanoarchaeia archaeon]|nr:hypothetical protein [Candidatus Nanoarchaeia archaeon]
MRKLITAGLLGLLSLSSCGKSDPPLFQVDRDLSKKNKTLRVYHLRTQYEPGTPATIFLIDIDGDGKVDQSVGIVGKIFNDLQFAYLSNDPRLIYKAAVDLKSEDRYIIPSDRMTSATMTATERAGFNQTIATLNNYSGN